MKATVNSDVGLKVFAQMKAEYEKAGAEPSNVRYGYVVPGGTINHKVFA